MYLLVEFYPEKLHFVKFHTRVGRQLNSNTWQDVYAFRFDFVPDVMKNDVDVAGY